MPTKIKHIKAQRIPTPVGEIIASVANDKLKNGREINSGVMFMQTTSATATMTDGTKYMIGASGADLVITAPSGRMFKTDAQKLIDHAVDYGLIDPNLKFEEEK